MAVRAPQLPAGAGKARGIDDGCLRRRGALVEGRRTSFRGNLRPVMLHLRGGCFVMFHVSLQTATAVGYRSSVGLLLSRGCKSSSRSRSSKKLGAVLLYEAFLVVQARLLCSSLDATTIRVMFLHVCFVVRGLLAAHSTPRQLKSAMS